MRVAVIVLVVSSWLIADKVYELKVPNMNCGGCASKIKSAASSVGVVKGFTQDFTTKDVNITLDDSTKIEDVIKAINNANYKASLKQ